DRHQVEVRELLAALHALGDPPTRVVDDVRVLAERGVVDLPDELGVLLLVKLPRRVREQHELLGHADSSSTRRLGRGSSRPLRRTATTRSATARTPVGNRARGRTPGR